MPAALQGLPPEVCFSLYLPPQHYSASLMLCLVSQTTSALTWCPQYPLPQGHMFMFSTLLPTSPWKGSLPPLYDPWVQAFFRTQQCLLLETMLTSYSLSNQTLLQTFIQDLFFHVLFSLSLSPYPHSLSLNSSSTPRRMVYAPPQTISGQQWILCVTFSAWYCKISPRSGSLNLSCSWISQQLAHHREAVDVDGAFDCSLKRGNEEENREQSHTYKLVNLSTPEAKVSR